MIITVTLNPALDKTASLDSLKVRGLNRLQNLRLDAGGKGLNVSAVIRALGGSSLATGFSGGGAGEQLLSLAAEKGLNTDFVRIAGNTRTNLKAVDAEGCLTELNEPGPEIKPEEWQQMEKKLSAYAKPGNTVVLSGSLPAGLGKDTYKNLTRMMRHGGCAVFLDADGEALKLALESPPEQVPDYIKPNRYELLQYFGIAESKTDSAAVIGEKKLVDMCRHLLDRGIKLVALSIGEDGAIFVNKTGAWKSPALAVKVKSTVGAGDSMTAALVYGFEQGLKQEQCFALAVAASAGSCTTEGTSPPERALVDGLLNKTLLEKAD